MCFKELFFKSKISSSLCSFRSYFTPELFWSSSVEINKKLNPSKRISSMDIYYSQMKLLVAYKSFRLNQFRLIGQSVIQFRPCVVARMWRNRCMRDTDFRNSFLYSKIPTSHCSTHINLRLRISDIKQPQNSDIYTYLFAPAPAWERNLNILGVRSYDDTHFTRYANEFNEMLYRCSVPYWMEDVKNMPTDTSFNMESVRSNWVGRFAFTRWSVFPYLGSKLI